MPYFERGRPSELEDGKQITLYCERHLIAEAKKMNLNLSEVLRNALATAIDNPHYQEVDEVEKRLKPVSIDKKKRIKRLIREGPEASIAWSKWIEKHHEIVVTPEELKTWAGY